MKAIAVVITKSFAYRFDGVHKTVKKEGDAMTVSPDTFAMLKKMGVAEKADKRGRPPKKDARKKKEEKK